MSGLVVRVLAASALLGGLLVAGAAIMLTAVADQHDSAERVHRSQEVLNAANRMERLVVDLETGVRGFLLTGQQRFLEPWERAQATLPDRSAELQALVADDPAQLATAREIDATVRELVEEHQAPVVARARDDLGSARGTTLEGERKLIVDALRARFQALSAAEQRVTGELQRQADDAETRALALGIGFLVGSVVLVALYALYILRTVIAPVRRVAGGARSIAAGDLAMRVPPGGAGEVAQLGRSFNAMAESLGDARAELESQNVELEHQQSEVESQNVELEHQQSELEQALEALAEEKDRVEAFFRFGEHLMSEPSFPRRAGVVLGDICDLVGADVGALYFIQEEGGAPELVATRGLDPELIPASIAPGDGLAGRALAENRHVEAQHGDTGLRAAAFGDQARAHHELHVPLATGERPSGVISLARLVDRPFAPSAPQLVTHLAARGAGALGTAYALRAAQRQAAITMAVIDATPDGIALVDAQGRPLLGNRAMGRLAVEAFGLEPGMPVWEGARELAPRTTDPVAFMATMDALRTDPEHRAFDEFELVSGRAFQVYATLVHDADGETIGRLFVLHEVTAEREAQRARDEFTALVSHELRTPLTSIMGFVELLRVEGADALADEPRHYVEIVGRNAERLLRLVDDILLMARVDAGRLRLEMQRVDVAALAAESVEGARPRAQAAGVDLRLVRAAPELPPVHGDRSRLGQVIDNLVSNAVKFTPRGGEAEVRLEAEDGHVEMVVSDTGIGIPPEERDHLFERFFRARSATEAGIAGTGLGLAVSRAIVEGHGGTITLDPPGPRGTTFRVRLPLVPPQPGGDGRP